MTVLVLHDVRKSFGGVEALTGVSLKVLPGMITGLIGPNGAGKTTIINVITGLLSVSGGSIHYGDTDITKATPQVIAHAGVARTFQTIRLLQDSSVLENIMVGFVRTSQTGLAANLLDLPAARRERKKWLDEAGRLLERFGMGDFAGYPAGKLSYGHQRRVEVMRALAARPSLLLLDEPAAGMNDVEAEKLGQIFRQLAADGLGVMLVEHNMRFIMSVCDHVHVLDSGRLIASGSPAEVASDTAVVNAYLGAA
jgi:branched-chain amino acid transport system ATP-binding protein